MSPQTFNFQSSTLRSMVNVGWDWKTGLRAQLDAMMRGTQYMSLVARLSAADKTTLVSAAAAINFY
jgi:hypothetical protein